MTIKEESNFRATGGLALLREFAIRKRVLYFLVSRKFLKNFCQEFAGASAEMTSGIWILGAKGKQSAMPTIKNVLRDGFENIVNARFEQRAFALLFWRLSIQHIHHCRRIGSFTFGKIKKAVKPLIVSLRLCTALKSRV